MSYIMGLLPYIWVVEYRILSHTGKPEYFGKTENFEIFLLDFPRELMGSESFFKFSAILEWIIKIKFLKILLLPYFQLPISNSLGQRFSKLPAHLNPRKVVKAIRKNVLYSCKHKFLLPKAFQSDLLFMGRHTLLTPPLEYHLLFEWPLFQKKWNMRLTMRNYTTLHYNDRIQSFVEFAIRPTLYDMS